jgi:hypothetical protein
LYLAISNKLENSGVNIGSIDSKEIKRLFSTRTEVRYALPGYLLFAGKGSLMAQPFDVGHQTTSGDPFPIADQAAADPMFGDGMFSVSENGVLVYRAGSASGYTQLRWFDRSGHPGAAVGAPGEYFNKHPG